MTLREFCSEYSWVLWFLAFTVISGVVAYFNDEPEKKRLWRWVTVWLAVVFFIFAAYVWGVWTGLHTGLRVVNEWQINP